MGLVFRSGTGKGIKRTAIGGAGIGAEGHCACPLGHERMASKCATSDRASQATGARLP